ncbi:hypothetical protein BU23DRAFT_461771 [Bimuria novae-zelandiae CBS 107.79]|uniref:2EXR domain-containing protein n=1 Tax=Bimuria novae-zelandiae CBS 107.79 TaxID=1447943 RepID=A0A6A5VB87_9PLEO|nr:hypothetical protein BU23DRAFT_461771 [Bimuria novae-zelandiae CBS 107.79]
MSWSSEALYTSRPQTSDSSHLPGSPRLRNSPPPSQSPSLTGAFTRALIWEQYLRVFVEHLKRWVSSHDSSTFFRGTIGVLAAENIQLGKSVRCVLTYPNPHTAQKQTTIRLFPPRKEDARYVMVVRCASGWMSAREFFNKEYFLQLQADRKAKELKQTWAKEIQPSIFGEGKPAKDIKSHPQAQPEHRHTVSISPLFHQFLELPQEIQDMIWVTAAGLTGMYRPCRHRTSDFPVPHIHENFYSKPKSPISVSTMLRVCKSLNAHMTPWIYRTTRFQFELTGFTNFLWVSGPTNRTHLRRVTFKFSSLAPLHCLRWLSPDPMFMLFDPPAYTSPHGLQYFWRCQIQDLARELHLHTLTLDLSGVPLQHVQMVVRILEQAFGSVKFVKFQDDGKPIDEGHWRLEGLKVRKTWRQIAREWFTAYKASQGYMSDARRSKTVAELERDMDAESEFFDAVAEGVQTC